MQDETALILTLEMAEEAARVFTAQRKRYFPPERNYLPAHITLFHHLPGEKLAAISADLAERAAQTAPLTVDVYGIRSLGRGVAYRLKSDEAIRLRESLKTLWLPDLQAQDMQKADLHITIQNKVTPVAAKALLSELQESFVPFSFDATGLHLWAYRNGPWESLAVFPFGFVRKR